MAPSSESGTPSPGPAEQSATVEANAPSPMEGSIFSSAAVPSTSPSRSISEVEATQIPRLVTGTQLGLLIQSAAEKGMNRAPPWREEGGRGFIEADGKVFAEIALDREYVLLPRLLHHHRGGQPVPPHWRCDLYALELGAPRRILAYFLDIYLAEFDALRPYVE
jgi:hypothetical protein